ncbi:MAG: hypothetical protein M4579_001512 [Chaenotheca gracillima]|nr:MAG: hypothetical protein M4579_001512 [Chaenotheca gracillima]
MSSSAPRGSMDSFASPISSPRSNQNSYPFYENNQRFSSPNVSRPRRGSATSSISSVGGFLDSNASRRRHSLTEVGQNAISTLLQPPIVRTGLVPYTSAPASSALRQPSARDIPPVTLTNVPHVDSSAFRPYLLQAGSLYEAFQRAKEEGGGGSHLFRRGRDSKNADSTAGTETGSRKPRPGQAGSSIDEALSPAFSFPVERPEVSRRRSSGALKRATPAATPLSTIPSVYFEDDFHLENPRTFDIVSEKSDVVRPIRETQRRGSRDDADLTTFAQSSGRKALATNAILQEKLSWYMDTVEVHLISSISTASTSFFAALGSLRELHSEASESVQRIQKLRGDLSKLDKEMAVGGLKVVGMRRRRENLKKLGGAVSQLRKIVDGIMLCEQLVDKGQVEQALDDLDKLQGLIAGETRAASDQDEPATTKGSIEPKHDLSGLKGLRGINDSFATLRLRIGQTYEARFSDLLLQDLRSHVEAVQPQHTIQRWIFSSQRSRGDVKKPPSFTTYLNLDESLRPALLSALGGLNRARHTVSATNSYREAVLRLIKSLIRKHLPSSNEDDAESVASVSTRGGRALSQQEKSTILARNLRDLSPGDAEDLLLNIYANVGEAIRRLSTQTKLLLDVTSAIGNPPGLGNLRSPLGSPNAGPMNGYMSAPSPQPRQTSSSLQQEQSEALDMSSLIGQAVDIAQSQVTKVLKVRTEQNRHLPLDAFLRYFTLNRFFVDECEAVSGRAGSALKGVVNSHIKEFVNQFGDSEKQMLAQGMDVDKWDAKDFGDDQSGVLGNILEASTKDVKGWSRPWKFEDVAPQASISVNGTSAENSREKVRSAIIDEEKFILPNSAIVVLTGVEKFEHLICGISSMTPEITLSLLEYLKLFNSRSCQLILGAGATRSAGLKNITTKHLALASQALSFIITLIPYIREFVRRHSSTNSGLMTEFDKVRRLYQEHQSGIHEKLVEIMSGRSTNHVKNMRKVDWDNVTAASQDDTVNSYVVDLMKETSTLHRVLSKHLPETTLQGIMGPVFTNYREQWGQAFQEAPVSTASGKERLVRDAEYFESKLKRLDESQDIGATIVGIAKGKVVSDISETKSEAESVAPAVEAPRDESNDRDKKPSVEKVRGSADEQR